MLNIKMKYYQLNMYIEFHIVLDQLFVAVGLKGDPETARCLPLVSQFDLDLVPPLGELFEPLDVLAPRPALAYRVDRKGIDVEVLVLPDEVIREVVVIREIPLEVLHRGP